MKPPLISVLVPTYNGAAYLDEALSAIQRQTYRRLEVLIRDDGSTDDTGVIAAEYVKADSRFSYIASDTEPGSTRNMIELLKLAQGDYIKVCNQDDVLNIRCAELLSKPLRSDASIIFSTSIRHLINGLGQTLEPMAYSKPLAEVSMAIEGRLLARLVILTGTNQIGEPSSVLFRNGVFEPEDTFTLNDHTYEVNNDIALWLKLLMRGNAFYYTQPLSKFRVHQGQRSADASEKVTGTLEWPLLLEWAIHEGLVHTGAEVLDIVRGVIRDIEWVSGVAAEDTPTMQPIHAARIAQGVERMSNIIREMHLIAQDSAA